MFKHNLNAFGLLSFQNEGMSPTRTSISHWMEKNVFAMSVRICHPYLNAVSLYLMLIWGVSLNICKRQRASKGRDKNPCSYAATFRLIVVCKGKPVWGHACALCYKSKYFCALALSVFCSYAAFWWEPYAQFYKWGPRNGEQPGGETWREEKPIPSDGTWEL